MFDQIEKLKTDLTDKFVVVDGDVPELARFGGHVGQVKTVNMNGRALVQFDTWNNIGWYDIDADFLRVVDAAEIESLKAEAAAKTAVAPAATKAPAKPAAAKAAAPAKPKPAAGGPKMSVADILAAARANKSGPAATAAPAATEAQASEPASAEAPAPAASKAASQAGGSKITLTPGQRPSVADILAWCRQTDSK